MATKNAQSTSTYFIYLKTTDANRRLIFLLIFKCKLNAKNGLPYAYCWFDRWIDTIDWVCTNGSCPPIRQGFYNAWSILSIKIIKSLTDGSIKSMKMKPILSASLQHREGYCSLPLHNHLWIWISPIGAIFIICLTFLSLCKLILST